MNNPGKGGASDAEKQNMAAVFGGMGSGMKLKRGKGKSKQIGMKRQKRREGGPVYGSGGEEDAMMLDDDLVDDDVFEGMEVDGGVAKEGTTHEKDPELVAFKDKVLDLLIKNDYETKRSSKLAIDDFMRILAIFNEAGIHFTC